MISRAFGQFGHFSGLGDLGDFGRGSRSRRRSSRSKTRNRDDQSQNQESGAGGDDSSDDQIDLDDSQQQQEEAIQSLLEQAQQQAQQQSRRRRSGRHTHRRRGKHVTASRTMSAAGWADGGLFDGALGVLGGIFGTAWGAACQLAGWAGVDLAGLGQPFGRPFGFFSALRPSQSSAWALPSPYAGWGASEVESAVDEARRQRNRGLTTFLHHTFAAIGNGNERAGQQAAANAALTWGPDAMVAIQEYLAARGDSPRALKAKLRVLRAEYARAMQMGRTGEAQRLYFRINAIESRLAHLGARAAATPGPDGIPAGGHVPGMHGDSAIPWKPILIGVAVIGVASVAAGAVGKGKRRHAGGGGAP